MLHLRVIAPSDQSSAVVDLLAADPGVTHLVVLPGAARQPAGDYVTCDVVRESADGVLSRLQELGVEAHGAIAADDVELIVNRPGGPVIEIAAVLDVIELMRAAVNVTCAGAAGGTAAALVACASGSRRAGPNARIRLCLDHEQVTGSAAEIDQRVEQLAVCRQQLAAALCRATGQPADVIGSELERGGWHDAADALRLGLIDVVADPRSRR